MVSPFSLPMALYHWACKAGGLPCAPYADLSRARHARAWGLADAAMATRLQRIGTRHGRPRQYPLARSSRSQRAAHNSPRRAPLTIASQTSIPQSGSLHASLTIRAACSADGGLASGRGGAGAAARDPGLTPIQRQRTARLSAAHRMAVDVPHGGHDSGRRIYRTYRCSPCVSSFRTYPARVGGSRSTTSSQRSNSWFTVARVRGLRRLARPGSSPRGSGASWKPGRCRRTPSPEASRWAASRSRRGYACAPRTWQPRQSGQTVLLHAGSRRRDSNPEPTHYKCGALPVAPRRRTSTGRAVRIVRRTRRTAMHAANSARNADE